MFRLHGVRLCIGTLSAVASVTTMMVCSLAVPLAVDSSDQGTVPAAAAQSTIVSLNSQAWSILYSPGMPPHPVPQQGGGWYFDFPTAPGSVNYVLAAVNGAVAASRAVNATISISAIGTPIFDYDFGPDNNCVVSAHVRLLLQQKGDDFSGKNGKQYFRWWSNAVAHRLAPGSANLRAALTDFSQWTSVFGEKANASAAAAAGYKQALANLGNVGFSFGGGCFYGHGVSVSGGSARFAITSYTLK
jgi:hypothetical protein